MKRSVLISIVAQQVSICGLVLVGTITAISFVGVWCLIVLFNKQVREGFRERAEELEG